EICNELGISLPDLLSLVNKAPQNSSSLESHYSIIYVIDKFKETLSKQHLLDRKTESTVRYYTYFLDRFKKYISEKDANLSIYNLNETLLDDFLIRCQGRKNDTLSSSTINTYAAILRRILSFAQNEGYIDKDLRKRFPRHKMKMLPRYFEKKQILEVFTIAKKKTHAYLWYCIIWVLLGTGCRVSELVNIRVKDFDIEEDILYTVGKGKKSRKITIYPQVKKVVLEYLELTGVKEWNKNMTGYLFARDHGTVRSRKVSVRSVQYQIHDIVTKLGYDRHLNVHSFRHTFAVNCLRSGMRIEYLSQLMGHANPATTYIYIQLLPIDLKNELMEKYPFPLELLFNELQDQEVK
ncbi:tyrosine-type recombinase/integrase, partial [Brevibacillus choshinensis]